MGQAEVPGLTNLRRKLTSQASREITPCCLLDDLRAAAEAGFDPICAYNLVLTPDLGTEWSRDGSLVQAMPGGARARATWLAVREALLDRAFDDSPVDLRRLHLTRNLSRLSVDAAYAGFFGTDLFDDFAAYFEVFAEAGLVTREGHTVGLTPDGMFYADAVAGLLARRRAAGLRRGADDGDARRSPMG